MIMTPGKWMILAGGIFLAVGLLSALRSNRAESHAIDDPARLDMPALAPEEGSPAYQERFAARQRADRTFRLSLGCTALGIALQTVGSIL